MQPNLSVMRGIIHIYKDSFSGLSRSIWILSIIMIINRAGAMVLPFMALYLTSSLRFSMTQAGWVMGAYGAGSIAGAYIGGQLADKYGSYHIQLYSLLCSAVALIILIFLKDFTSITILVFSFSTISDTLRPANSVAIAAYSTPETRTRSFSLMRFATNVGFSIGPAVGGLIAATLGYTWIFVVDAITCLIAAALLMYYLGPPVAETAESDEKPVVQPSRSAYRDPIYLIFIFLVALYAIAFFQLFTSIPLFWKDAWDFSPTETGMLLALNGLIVVLVEMPFIRKIEHISRQLHLVALGSLLLLISFGFLLLGWPSLIFAGLYILAISVSEIFAMPFMTNFAVSRPAESRRGQYMALYAMAYGIAHVVAPAGSMYVAEHFGFQTLFIGLMVLSGLITAAFYMLQQRVTNT
jgi:predicted MFS family arabinose efflux permease